MYLRNSCRHDLCHRTWQSTSTFHPRHSLCFLAVAGVSSCPNRCRFQNRGVGKGYEAERKRTLLMNSNFYYPINTGSLGEPRRARTFNSSIQRRTSDRFEANANRMPTISTTPTILVVEDDDDSLTALKKTPGTERLSSSGSI